MLVGLVVEHEEHVLAVLAPVARDLPQRLVVEQRRLHLVIVVALQLAQVIVDRVDDDRAALGPEHGARRELVEHEEVELAPDDAMVAPLRLLDAEDVRVEILLLPPRRRVDALQLLTLHVAAPVRRRRVFSSLKCLRYDVSGHVRTAAQIDERSVGVGRDHFVRAEILDALELERIVGEPLERLAARDLLAHERILLRHDLPHLGLERGEILGRERLGDLEVVVEAVVDRRTEADLRIGAAGA